MTITHLITLLNEQPFDRQRRLAQGLRPLLEASIDALGLQCEPAQFAIPLAELLDAGLNGHDVRWLLACGVIQNAVDHRSDSLRNRARRGLARAEISFVLALVDASKVLAWSDAVIAVEFQASPSGDSRPSNRPRWDHDRQELWMGSMLVKKYKVPAANQILILSTFEEVGWLARIDDPLPRSKLVDPTDRLKEAIKSLNRGQSVHLIQFHGDGNGRGVCWSATTPLRIAPATPKKVRLR